MAKLIVPLLNYIQLVLVTMFCEQLQSVDVRLWLLVFWWPAGGSSDIEQKFHCHGGSPRRLLFTIKLYSLCNLSGNAKKHDTIQQQKSSHIFGRSWAYSSYLKNSCKPFFLWTETELKQKWINRKRKWNHNFTAEVLI